MKTQEEIQSLLARGLEAAANEHAVATLGDRRCYLGMSDLARGLSCPRTVAARKFEAAKAVPSLDRLLQLRRGHWLELGIEEALSALGIKFISQLEISVQHQGVPIKAHLDLVLPDEASQSITVLELKSVGHLRNHAYGSHEAQLYGQLGLLHKFWNAPVFNVCRDWPGAPASPGPCSFPELANRQLGISLAKDVGQISILGFVVTVSPKVARAFGPYRPNDTVLDILLAAGQELWRRLAEIKSGQATLQDIAFQQGFDPLCDWCRHNNECPKFKGADHNYLEPELASLSELKKARANIDVEIKEREEQLKSIAALMGLSGQWISTPNYRFKAASQKGRSLLDQEQLKRDLAAAQNLDLSKLENIIAAAHKSGASFERFYLSPINKESSCITNS